MRITLILLLTLIATCGLQAQDKYNEILSGDYSNDGPGAAALVAKGDQILYRGAVGMADIELGVQATVDHIFRLGSITKQFTAVGILMLQEEGKLDVSDDMTRYIPDYPVGDHMITIEHLLTHTSGIMSYTNIPGFMQNSVYEDLTVDELIDVFKDEPIEFAPGERWNYNNSGYILLGKIIEVVSGMTYEKFVEDKIFKPLGMNDSHYDNNDELIDDRVPGYSTNGAGEVSKAKYISMTLPYAAGSLMSTVDDLYKWNKAVMAGEVVDSEIIKHAFEEYKLNDGTPCGYGYGWAISSIAGKPIYEHGGGIMGFTTQGVYVPDEDVYVIVLTNTDGRSPAGVAHRMAALAIGESLEFDPIEISPDVLEEYVGVYAIENSDQKRVVTVADGVLFTQRAGGVVFPVIPYAKDKFYYEDSRTKLEFDRDGSGKIVGQTVTPASGEAGYAILTEEAPAPAETVVEIDTKILENYTGVYQIMEGFDITVTIEDGALKAQATGQSALELEAYSDRRFGFPPAGIKMEFPAAENGKAPYFMLYQAGQEIKASRK